MRRLTGLLVLTGMLIACAPILYPDVMVAIPSAGGALWDMRLEEKGTLTLFIDNDSIGSTQMPGVGSIRGTFQGHAIQAQCSQSADDFKGSCVVYVDGTQVATLLL